jgi:hypothetical protein
MKKSTKPVWVLCPRCELNYIKKADQYCNVCKKEMKLIEASDDDIGDLELCPICKINFVQSDQEVCDSCKQELGIVASEEAEDREISDWHKYISDDDEDDMIAAVDLLRFVVENGAPLSPPDKNFYGIDCLLGYASRNNHSLVCQYLLDNDFFDVNDVVDEYGATALIVAAKAPNETFGACKVLLENGADQTLKDNFGKTAYDYAVKNGHKRLIDLLEDSKI